MISVKSNIIDIKSNKSVLKGEENSEKKNCNVFNDEIEKTVFLISEEKIDSLTPESSSLSPKENGPYERHMESAEIENCADTCSSFDGNEFNENNLKNHQNELIYESDETEESESETENSTEDEDSDENDPDQTNNSIMQERWKELDKYGTSSHILNNNENHNNPMFRLATPVNLSATASNHHLSENPPLSSNYCLNNTPIIDDTFMLGINTHPSNNALNMSMRHMSAMKSISSIKNSHFHSIENDSNYHIIQSKPYKLDTMHCRMPHQNPNILLNNPSLNYDYSKQQRHTLNHREFNLNDMRSEFQKNMMMNGSENDALSMSNLSHSHMQDFQCNYCNKCYTNQSSLRSHLKKHMNIDEKKYKCDKCSYSSQYQKNLLKHIHINHEDFSDTQHCRCDICDRMFSSEFLLKDHLRMHTNDNTYQCNQCGKKLKTKLKLRYHADVHNPEKPYVCDVDSCDRAFRTPKYLKNHKDEFHKLQPKKHFCPVDNCKLVFQRKSHLKRHMAMHDGEKNYHCHWPDCNRSFRSQETLNVHLIRHTGEKPFKCELCEYSCRQKASLNYHCRNAHAKDCERLLGLKPFVNEGKPPGTRPVGRPPRNRLEDNNAGKLSILKYSGLEGNELKLELQAISHINEKINHFEKNSNVSEIFKKPAPMDENDVLKKEIFMIVDDVIGNPPRDYGNVDQFSLEELCLIELSIKSKRGRKRKVLKELDALLAQNLNENQISFEDDDDDSASYKDSNNNLENDEDTASRSPINISKIQYTPSIMQSSFVSGTNQSCISNQSLLRPMNYSNINDERVNHHLQNRSSITTPETQSLIINAPLKLVKNHKISFASINNSSGHSNGVSSFNASYILRNNSDPCVTDNPSISGSNTPLSGKNELKHEESGNIDESINNIKSEINVLCQQLPWLSPEPANLSCHKRNLIPSSQLENPVNKPIRKSSPFSDNDTELNEELNLQKHLETPIQPPNSFETLKRNKDLLDQVLDNLKVIPNDEEYNIKPFLSPTSTTSLSNPNNLNKNVTEFNHNIDNIPKSTHKISANPTSLKLLTNENNNQPKSLDSSLWSDSGYSSGHDSSGLNKENSGISNVNAICSTISIPSIGDKNYKMSSPSSNAAAAFIEKTAAAAEMAALSASAALLNSDFYSSYQQNIGNNRSSGESNYSPYDGSGFNTELTSMNNICSSMYKSGLEDHLRSLTAFGTKYMENNVYHGNSRSNNSPGPDANGIGPFNHLWPASASSTGDYLTMNSNESSGGSSLNPFDPANMRNGIGDYCNLAQSPTVAAAADFYSQMTASANYDKYSSLYGCRDSFYDNSTSASRSLSALNNGSSYYAERNYLPPSHPFYPQAASSQYGSRYPPTGASAADYLSMGRQFSSGGSSGNPFSVCNDPYRNSVLHNMSPFSRYPF